MYPSFCKHAPLLLQEADMLQNGPGAVLPAHLVPSLMGLPLHLKPPAAIEDQVVKSFGKLSGSGRVYQDAPRMAPNHHAG